MASRGDDRATGSQKAMTFWEESEIQKYGNPSLFQGNPDLFLCTFQLHPTNYYMGKEFFIGVEKRNDTLFELRTMFFVDYPTENQLAGVFTLPIIKHSEEDSTRGAAFTRRTSWWRPARRGYPIPRRCFGER